MRGLSLVVVFVCACGSVAVKSDGGKDGTTADTAGDSAPTCGLAGQACCANNMCTTNLKCTTADQVCRTAEVFFAAADAGNENGTVTVGHGLGANFTLQQLGTGQPQALWGTSSQDVWVIAQGPTGTSGQTAWARHWDGAQWGPQMNFPAGNIVYALWGNAPDNYWAVNNGGSVLHWNGQAWSQPMDIAGSLAFTQIWGSSNTDLYAIAGSVYHMDSSGMWMAVPAITGWGGSTLRAVSGRPNGDFISGGVDNTQQSNPSVLRHSGNTFTVEQLGSAGDCAETYGVWDGPTDAWAITASAFQGGVCNAKPTFVHYDAGVWTKAGLIPDAGFVSALWGTSDKDLYTFGTNAAGSAALLHYDGTTWTTPYSTTAVASIRAIWGLGGLP